MVESSSDLNSFAIYRSSVYSFFFSLAYLPGVSCNSANLGLSSLVDSLLSNEERSFTPFPLMKRTARTLSLSVSPCFPSSAAETFSRFGTCFHRDRRAVFFHVRTHAREYTRARALTHASTRARSRGRAFSARVCAACLRHGGSVACRNVRLKERLARTGSLPFPRRRPPKGVVSCISATTQSAADNGPRSHRAFKR